MTYRRDCVILSPRGEAIPAKFHRWGNNYFTNDSNERHPLTVAIVEKRDGTVMMCSPEEIQFTGPATAHEALEQVAERLRSEPGYVDLGF